MDRWNKGRKVSIPDYDPKKRVVCEVCGSYIKLESFRRYSVLEHLTVSLFNSKTLQPEIARIYDAFDCPVCGCQYVAKERLRNAE